MVDPVSPVSGAGFSNQGGGRDVSLQNELQALSNQVLSPPGGNLSKNQLSGMHDFLQMLGSNQPSDSPLGKLQTLVQQIKQESGGSLSPDQLSKLSKAIQALASATLTMNEMSLAQVMTTGLQSAKSKINSPDSDVVDHAKGTLIAISSFLSGGAFGDKATSMGTQVMFDLNSNATIAAYENDINTLLQTHPFNHL